MHKCKCDHEWEFIALVDVSDEDEVFPEEYFLKVFKCKKCGETKKEDL